MTANAALGGVMRGYRRVLIVAAALGAAGMIVATLLGHYKAGLTLCVGLALGFINTRLMVAAAARFAESQNRSKRPIVLGSLRRLGVLTAVALLVAYEFRPDGIATLGGLALFQILLLGNTSTTLIGELRRTNQ